LTRRLLDFVNPDGSGLENVTNAAGIDEGSPAWAPDGQKLAYVRIESGSPQSIWTMNRNGTGQTALTSDPAGADSPSWSLTGAKIAFARAGDIYSINVDGTGLTDLTNTPYTEYQPAWQQRGRPPLFFYPRPRNASPTNIRLVPAYKACAAPNGMHGEPLHSPSCDPPVLASDYLTTGGTPAVGANGSGLIILKVFCTDATAPPCPASGDQEDVGLTASITDVRKKTDGSDYTGELRASLPLRVTDRYNAVALFYPATAVDVSIGFRSPAWRPATRPRGALARPPRRRTPSCPI
jgi:WD40 repeat protein